MVAPGVRPVSVWVTTVLAFPSAVAGVAAALCGYGPPAVGPHSKLTVASDPLALTVPLSVAEVSVTAVAASVVAVGGVGPALGIKRALKAEARLAIRWKLPPTYRPSSTV